MPTSPVWLNQTHSADVIELSKPTHHVLDADGATTRHNKIVCCVMTADCLPVLLTNTEGSQVAAVHAGWRGLANGILENAVRQFDKSSQVMAWLGPAIGPTAFEVGKMFIKRLYSMMSMQRCLHTSCKTEWQMVSGYVHFSNPALKPSGRGASVCQPTLYL